MHLLLCKPLHQLRTGAVLVRELGAVTHDRFRIEWLDTAAIQRTTPADDPSGGTLLVNAGKTQVKGIDLLARFAFGREVVLDAGATFLDLKSKSLTVPASLLPYLAVQAVPFNLVAKTTVTAGARFTLPAPESLW